MIALQHISQLGHAPLEMGKNGGQPGQATVFDTVMKGVEHVDQEQHTANDALADLAAGRRVDLHGTFIQLEQADISLRTMVSVRNRMIAAYEQVMNMAL